MGAECPIEVVDRTSQTSSKVNSETLALIQNSRISADAVEGEGGNIAITTEGIFVSPDSSITASSQLGVDGIVTVTEPEVDTSSALVQLSDDPIDPATQVVSACAAAAENTFVVTGNGGLPPDPTGVLRGQTVWVDTREIREPNLPTEYPSNETEETEESSLEPPLVEATGWQQRDDGTVELVATPQNPVGNRWRDRLSCGDRF